jgi:hypothetical protein
MIEVIGNVLEAEIVRMAMAEIVAGDVLEAEVVALLD